MEKPQNKSFTHTTFQSDWSNFLGPDHKAIIEGTSWRIIFNHSWIKIFSNMILSECKNLEIKSQNTQTQFFQFRQFRNEPEDSFEIIQDQFLLSDIVHISFPYLTTIQLRDLNLASIESLVFLRLQNLKGLNLAGNKISSLKALNKQKWDNLSDLNLNRNKIREIKIHRTKLCNNFLYLNFDHYCHNNFYRIKNQIQVQDISNFVKFQSSKLKRFILSEVWTYLDQPVIIKKLKDRFPGINLISPDIFMMWS